jgi:WD40 repeat protein
MRSNQPFTKTGLLLIILFFSAAILLAACAAPAPPVSTQAQSSPTALPTISVPTPTLTLAVIASVPTTQDLPVIDTNTPPAAVPTAAATPLARENTPIPLSNHPIARSDASQVVQLARLGKGAANDIAYSPDGSILAVASSLGFYLYNDQQRLLDVIETDSPVTSLAFSPDNETLAAGLTDGVVQFWRWKDRHLARTLQIGGAIQNLKFSPRADSIAFFQAAPESDNDQDIYQYVHVISISDGTLLFIKPTGYQAAFQYSADGLSIYVADGFINKYLISDGSSQDMWSLDAGQEQVNNMELSTDNTLMVASGPDAIYLWNFKDAAPYKSFRNLSDKYSSAHFLYLADTCHFSIDGGGYIQFNFAISPNKRLLALQTNNGSFQIRRVSDGALLSTTPDKTKYGQSDISVSEFSFNPHNSTLAVMYTTGLIELYNPESLRLVGSIPGFTSEYGPLSISPALSAGSRYLASAASDDTLRIWNIPSGQRATNLPVEASSVAFSPNGNYLAFGSREWQVNLLRLKDGKLLGQQSGHLDWVNGLAFLPGGTLISGSDDCTLRIWQIGDRLTLKDTLQGTKDTPWGRIQAMSTTSDGLWIIGLSDLGPDVFIYNTKTQAFQFPPEQYGQGIAISPDNRSYALVSGQSLQIWDLATLNKVQESNISGTQVTYSPDGSLLAVGHTDGSIDLLDTQTLQVVKTLNGHRDEITSLAFSLDGLFLASASDDGTIRIWGIPK